MDYPDNDYGFECSNCGKPMSFRFCGMCWHCEQEYNDIGLDDYDEEEFDTEAYGNKDITEDLGEDDNA